MQNKRLKKYGIMIDGEDGSIGINYNKFVKQLLKHHIIIYSHIGRFYIYRDSVYQQINENDLMRLVKEVIDSLLSNMWKNRYGRTVVDLLSVVAPKIDNMNKDMEHLCLLNGILSLSKNKILPHSPEYYLTSKLPIVYDPKAKCPRFKQFLKEIFDEDNECICLAQEWFGYCLTNLTNAQKCLFLFGVGANGKSVLLDVLMKLVGKDSLSTLPLVEFESSFRRCALVDKKINVVTEGGFRSNSLNTNQLKAVIAGETIMAEIKGGDSFNFVPYCKVIAALNSMPRIQDTSHGFRRRICLLTFNRIFKPEEQNKNLAEELEGELSGILNFALKGLKRLIKNEFIFTEPLVCKEELDMYFEYNDPLTVFVKHNLAQADLKLKIKNEDLHDKYIQWCQERNIGTNGYDRLQFACDIKNVLKAQNIDFETGMSNGRRHLKGIRWKKG